MVTMATAYVVHRLAGHWLLHFVPDTASEYAGQLTVPAGMVDRWVVLHSGYGLLFSDGSADYKNWMDPTCYYATREEAEEALALHLLRGLS